MQYHHDGFVQRLVQDEMLARLQRALPVDAVVLGLRGAEMPLHNHLTAKRVAAPDFLTVFKEFPHTDFVGRAEGLWRILAKQLGRALLAIAASI
ncbi:M81 family metallopeptidase [Rhodobacter sp. 24-YEA-8]|uniref:M81 family metallopeptidase n=1 Tax=Rhodobacter sp. 24-YEA-8 TaxID=1884310 RepID=UPI00209B9CF9|nr:M81 family metallopeptidase [Rhodobacter sp. 24-YEA-8]